MVSSLRLYVRLLTVSALGQLQYRASLVLRIIGQALGTGIDFLGIWMLFDRFGSLRGWDLMEVALFYGIINVGFALAESIAGGFDTFGQMVKSGDFDRILVRPRSAALQIAGRELQLRRIGSLLQGLAVLIYATSSLSVQWSVAKVGLLLVTIVGGACLFCGIFVLQATLSFWTVESLEIMNTLSYGGRETGQYPLSIYRTWFRRFFTAVVPLACVGYYPALVILDRPDPLGSPEFIGWLAPLVGVVFLLVCLRLWHVGVRHYRSTGS